MYTTSWSRLGWAVISCTVRVTKKVVRLILCLKINFVTSRSDEIVTLTLIPLGIFDVRTDTYSVLFAPFSYFQKPLPHYEQDIFTLCSFFTLTMLSSTWTSFASKSRSLRRRRYVDTCTIVANPLSLFEKSLSSPLLSLAVRFTSPDSPFPVSSLILFFSFLPETSTQSSISVSLILFVHSSISTLISSVPIRSLPLWSGISMPTLSSSSTNYRFLLLSFYHRLLFYYLLSFPSFTNIHINSSSLFLSLLIPVVLSCSFYFTLSAFGTPGQ